MFGLGANREKFTTPVDTEILAAVRDLARSEGRQLQALVDEPSPTSWKAQAGPSAAPAARWRPDVIANILRR